MTADAVEVLTEFLDSLPQGHHDRPGVIRAVEVLTHGPSGAADGRRRCAYIVDSLGNSKRRGNGNRPWWRRTCKRWATPGSRYCWQHGGAS